MSRPSPAGTGRRYLRTARRYFTGAPAWFVLGVATVTLLISARALVLPPPANERGELVILSGADDSVGQQRQRLVDEWNRLHPDNPARVESLSSQADAQHSEMVARAQSGDSGVDVYNLDVTWIAEFAAAGFIRPLDGSVNTAGFLEAPLRTCYFDDRLWGLPFNTDAGLLFYRTDVVRDAAALPAQLPPSEADMQALVGAGAPIQAGYVSQLARYEGLTVNALEAIWAAGGDVVSEDRVVIDSADARAGLQQLARGLATTADRPPAILPASTGYTEKTSTEAFRSGTVALMRNWPVAYGQLTSGRDQSGQGFDIAANFSVTTLPGPSVLGGQNLAIANDSRRPRAAQQLIEFLTSDSSELQLFRDGGFAATRASAYDNVSVREKWPYAQTLRSAVASARPRPLTTHYALFSSVLQEVVSEALTQQGTLPGDAVARLTDALNGRLR